jgi:hypothetical protein
MFMEPTTTTPDLGPVSEARPGAVEGSAWSLAGSGSFAAGADLGGVVGADFLRGMNAPEMRAITLTYRYIHLIKLLYDAIEFIQGIILDDDLAGVLLFARENAELRAELAGEILFEIDDMRALGDDGAGVGGDGGDAGVAIEVGLGGVDQFLKFADAEPFSDNAVGQGILKGQVGYARKHLGVTRRKNPAADKVLNSSV